MIAIVATIAIRGDGPLTMEEAGGTIMIHGRTARVIGVNTDDDEPNVLYDTRWNETEQKLFPCNLKCTFTYDRIKYSLA